VFNAPFPCGPPVVVTTTTIERKLPKTS
jgi:hypothetical protein